MEKKKSGITELFRVLLITIVINAAPAKPLHLFPDRKELIINTILCITKTVSFIPNIWIGWYNSDRWRQDRSRVWIFVFHRIVLKLSIVFHVCLLPASWSSLDPYGFREFHLPGGLDQYGRKNVILCMYWIRMFIPYFTDLWYNAVSKKHQSLYRTSGNVLYI